MNLYVNRRNGENPDGKNDPDHAAPCPICGWAKTNVCLSCHLALGFTKEGRKITECSHCGADVRRIPLPRIADPRVEELEKRIVVALKCLDELVVIVMQRIALMSRIDEEDLVEAFGMGIEEFQSDTSSQADFPIKEAQRLGKNQRNVNPSQAET
jgi:hypothetical protein